MLKQIKLEQLEQKKAVAKMSKLCLGALTSVDNMETKINENQAMEKFKKLSEESVKLNSHVQQNLHDVHLKLDRLGNHLDMSFSIWDFWTPQNKPETQNPAFLRDTLYIIELSN